MIPVVKAQAKLSIVALSGNDNIDIAQPISLIATLPGGGYSRYTLKLGDVILETRHKRSEFYNGAYVITGYYPESVVPTLGKSVLTLSCEGKKVQREVNVTKFYHNDRVVDFTGLDDKNNSELGDLINSYFSLNGTKVAKDCNGNESYMIENSENNLDVPTLSIYAHKSDKTYSLPQDGNDYNPIEIEIAFSAEFTTVGDALAIAVYPKDCGGQTIQFTSPLDENLSDKLIIARKDGVFADGTPIKYGRKYNFELKLNRRFLSYELHADAEKLFGGDISFDKAMQNGAKKDVNAVSLNASAKSRVLLDNISIMGRNGIGDTPVCVNKPKLHMYYPFDKKNDLIYETNGGSIDISAEADNTHNNVLAISRTGGNNRTECQIILPRSMDGIKNYTVEFDVKLFDNKGIINLLGILDDKGTYTTGFSFTGYRIYVNGESIAAVEKNKWYNMAFSFNYNAGTVSVYIDDVLKITKKISNMADPDIFITGLDTSSEGSASYYMDNLQMYSGNTITEYTTDELLAAAEFDSILETESEAKHLINKASLFMSGSDSYYISGTKYSYAESGYKTLIDNEKFMLPQTLIEKGFDVSLDYKDGTLKINGALADDVAYIYSDGNLYVSIEDMAEAVSDIYLYHDGRGLYMIDSKPIAYTNSEIATNITEPIDTIYRYMVFERPSADEILSAFNSQVLFHPRLITTKADITEIKALVKTDNIMKTALANTETKAKSEMAKAQVTQSFNLANSFLDSARSSMERIRLLGIAYAVTDNTDYAKAAWESMENVMNWTTWNEDTLNYLDTSETAYGLVIGYDLIYDYLSDTQRQQVEDAVFNRFLEHTASAYRGRHRRLHWVTGSLSNWSFVCNGASVAACLAFADRVKGDRLDTVKFILENALQSIEHSLMGFYPDGAWPEGPGYWQYSMMYLYGGILAPLKNSCGHTFGLEDTLGLGNTLKYTISTQGPSGMGFNFGDTFRNFVERDGTGYLIALTKNDDEEMAKWYTTVVNNGNKGDEKTLLWYRPCGQSTTQMTLDNYYKGTGVGVMRASYTDNQSSYVGIKGGYTEAHSHSNLDAGSFIFDNLGVRWAEEMGFDNYNIPNFDYWGNHHQLYVVRPEGQNVLVINPREDNDSTGYWGGQLNHKNAPLTLMTSSDVESKMALDLGEVYAEDVNSYTRTFTLGDNKTSLTIKDELELKNDNGDIYWFMHTRASISISSDKKEAILTKDGKKLKITAVSNAEEYSFEVRDIKPFSTSPQISGQLTGGYAPGDMKKLTLKLNASGKTNIEVKIAPAE